MALGRVSDTDKSAVHDSESAAGQDDFTRALNDALDAIKTAIDDDAEARSDVPQQARPHTGWMAKTAGEDAPSQRDRRTFKEISSGIASRHPELRFTPQPPSRPAPMPAAATLASSLLNQPANAKRSPAAQPCAPRLMATRDGDADRKPPTHDGISAHDGAQPRGHGPAQRRETAPASRETDPYWPRLISDIQHDLDAVQQERRAEADMPPAAATGHDDAPVARPRGIARTLAVSSLGLAVAIGLGATVVWLGKDLAGRGGSTDVADLTVTPAVPPVEGVPAATDDNPARLQVGAVSGTAGEAVPLRVALTASPGERTAILISGLPDDGTLSAGVDTGKGVWIVRPGDLDRLALTTASAKPVRADVKFELVASNGLTLDVQNAPVTLAAGGASPAVAAGLAPKPVKTATLTFGAPALPGGAELPSAKDETFPAPPVTPRAEGPVIGSGDGGLSAAPEPGSVQLATQPPHGETADGKAVAAPAAPRSVRVAAVAPANIAPPVERVATPAPVPPEVEEMVKRGDTLMNSGDLASARLFFERAAEGGSARAALAMAMSYDPLYFAERDVQGMPPHPENALKWYRKAIEMGAPEASDRLSALQARLPRS